MVNIVLKFSQRGEYGTLCISIVGTLRIAPVILIRCYQRVLMAKRRWVSRRSTGIISFASGQLSRGIRSFSSISKSMLMDILQKEMKVNPVSAAVWTELDVLPDYSYCLLFRIDRVNVLRADHDSIRLNLSRRLKKIRTREWENVPDDANDEELDEVPDETGTTALAVEREVCSRFWPEIALDWPRVHFECLVRTTSDFGNYCCYDHRRMRVA